MLKRAQAIFARRVRDGGRSDHGVGHSVGGHAILLSSATRALTAGVLVAAHAGVTRTVRGALERLRVWSVMRLLAPVLCRVAGYMPGRRVGLGEDLPRPTAVSLLLAPVVNASIERHDIAPADVGLAAIGHMGFFRKRNGASLWPRVADWLLAQCAVREDAQ